jgi:1-deoxy-D-xylulose-5-phosphate synthase
MVVMTPSDENECRQMLYTATTLKGPSAVRYPRGAGPGVKPEKPMTALPVGKAVTRREGRSGLAILNFGPLLPAVLAAADLHDATVLDMRFVKPLDRDAVLRVALKARALVTVEENVVAGGAGSAVGELLAENAVALPLLHVGIPDRFIEHGSREECLAMAGLDAASIRQRISEWWHALQRAPTAASGGA